MVDVQLGKVVEEAAVSLTRLGLVDALLSGMMPLRTDRYRLL